MQETHFTISFVSSQLVYDSITKYIKFKPYKKFQND